ncbi:MAG: hypothetical protein JNM34_11570 [Chthonomonadaceae bacterium]|nr:hypothetical protein [Chthonomonadaceae bacterium]
MICPQCFEDNDDGAEFCRECGAPFKSGSDASDMAVYKELAKANLLKMRGDMKSANDTLLSILKRFPNNPTAHSLLGDISADQGDLQQAKTWYEMAVELVPDNKGDKEKLARITSRIAEDEKASATQIIGIPERKTLPGAFIALSALIVVAIAVGSFWIGNISSPKKEATDIVPYVPPKPVEQPNPADPAQGVNPETQEPTQTPQSPEKVQTDEAMLTAIRAKSVDKLEWRGLVEDPRAGRAIVTVSASATEPPSLTATKAGLAFFETFPAFKTVTVRVLGSKGYDMIADMTAESATTVKAAISGGDTVESQSQVALSNTWMPPAPEASTGTAGGNVSR